MTDRKRFRVALIGAGARGRHLADLLTKTAPEAVIATAFDPADAAFAALTERLGYVPERRDSYQAAIADPNIDAAMIFSPNRLHAEQAIFALEQGKDTFLEKPPVTTVAAGLALAATARRSGKALVTGFVLRYSPYWERVREMLRSGAFGEIVSVRAVENLRASHGSHIMKGWRRFEDFSGSHMLEKCSHDIDLLNWLMDDVPRRAASFGGLKFFVPKNAGLQEKYRGADGVSPFDGWKNSNDPEPSPFLSEKTVVDHQVVALEYRNGASACFQTTLANAAPEKLFSFCCSEGNIMAEPLACRVTSQRYLEEQSVETLEDAGSHSGGDSRLMEEFAAVIAERRAPRFSGEDGIRGALAALAIEEARKTLSVVDLTPIWEKLKGAAS